MSQMMRYTDFVQYVVQYIYSKQANCMSSFLHLRVLLRNKLQYIAVQSIIINLCRSAHQVMCMTFKTLKYSYNQPSQKLLIVRSLRDLFISHLILYQSLNHTHSCCIYNNGLSIVHTLSIFFGTCHCTYRDQMDGTMTLTGKMKSHEEYILCIINFQSLFRIPCKIKLER